MLSEGGELRFEPVPAPTHEQLIEFGYLEVDTETKEETQVRNKPDAKEWADNLGMTTHYDLPDPDSVTGRQVDGVIPTVGGKNINKPDRYNDNSIQTLLFPEDLENTLRTLQRKTVLAQQEMGTNILYLACGFLEWFDSDQADKGRVAPLFLLPVNIRKDKLNTQSKTFEYLISYSGEDITPNLSLREKLKTDFSLELPELPVGEEISVEDYLKETQNMFRVMYPRWRILRHATLGFFDFTKLLMYLDLDPDSWPEDKPLISHPVIAQFLGGTAASRGQGGTVSEEYDIDKLENVHSRYPLVFDADSSQHSAIVEVLDGNSLVVEGPPGTGKSQSITNLIAAAIASGKRVLFVAEKLAALEVVKRRLDSAGLGDFVLELHSHKTHKRQLLDSIDQRIKKRGQYADPAGLDAEIARYERLREDLSAYVELINSEWQDTGLTIFKIFTAATRYREQGRALLEREPSPNTKENSVTYASLYRPETRQTQLEQIEHFSHVFSATVDQAADRQSDQQSTGIASHPWYGINNDGLFAHDANKVAEVLQDWQNRIDQAKAETALLARHVNSKPSAVAASLDELYQLPDQLRGIQLPGTSIDSDALGKLTEETVLARCQAEFELLTGLAEQHRRLLPVIANRFRDGLNIDQVVQQSSDSLSSRIKGDYSLAEVVQIAANVNAVSHDLDRLNSSVASAASGLPSAIQTALYSGTENGVRNCKDYLASIDALDPRLSTWRVRCRNFNQLQPVALRLQKEIREVMQLRTKISSVLNIRRLGDIEKIRSLLSGYQSGGTMRWLSSEWRKYRSTLQKLGASDNIPIEKIITFLPDGIRFSELCYELEHHEEYRSIFGDDYRGVNTEIDSMVEVCNWATAINHHWATQENSNQWIGSLMEMSANTEANLRGLVDGGAIEHLEQTLSDLDRIRVSLKDRDPLHLPQTALVGSNGGMETLSTQINRSTEQLIGFFGSEGISVGDVHEQLLIAAEYQASHEKWAELVSTQSLLSDVFQIDIEHVRANDEAHVKMSSTLAFSKQLDETVSNAAIADFVAVNPHENTATALCDFASRIESAVSAEQQARTAFNSVGHVDFNRWLQSCGTDFDLIESRNYRAITNLQMLSGWLDYQRVTNRMVDYGLQALAVEAENGTINPGELRNRLSSRIDKTEVAGGQAGAYVGDLTDLKLLTHETRKKRRHIPIRQLIGRASTALVQLKPCFMMGPLSAAQYLEPGQLEFDLVVMDEASQIKPEDALGVIARGKQLVVVGDPKQLPPTNFFNRAIDDEEEEETAVVSEQESILDATVPMFNTRRLRWHYRSRHEKLIAFSNEQFYESNLVVFPSPARASEELGIKYCKVDGTFENRTNSEEAQQIAEMVRTHFQQYRDDSIGVVAMNTSQRELIDANIESLSREDPLFLESIEQRQNSDEPLFVKNLENVQGDERDVIVISMTYGPAESGGRVMQRFGPINSADGWRRLNVLLTRSRKRMLVYSSMSSSDIVISPTSSRGVYALRDLLAYLETGTLHKTRHTGREPDSDFEIDVIHRLEQRGYTCEPQIGVAGFFIDLAVIDPDSPGKFIVGIECDGATYHSARSARDRDRLRESVLTGLGWEIRRIWSTDYFKNPNGEIDRIVRAIQRLRAKHPAELKPATIGGADESSSEQQQLTLDINPQGAGMDEGGSTATAEAPPAPATLDEALTAALNSLSEEYAAESAAPAVNQLLRPDIVNALVEYKPLTVDEYNAFIPSFLRRAVHESEDARLGNVVGLIQQICMQWEL